MPVLSFLVSGAYMPHVARSRRKANEMRRLIQQAKTTPLHMLGKHYHPGSTLPVSGQLDRAEANKADRKSEWQDQGHNFPTYKTHVATHTGPVDGRTRTIKPLLNLFQRKLCGCYFCTGVSR